MKLEVIKGKETSLVIEDVVSSINEENFLNKSYLKALDAICEYLRNSMTMVEELKQCTSFSARNQLIYGSAYNIIALSGKRGSGKSSAMLSLSHFLENPSQIAKLNESTDKFEILSNKDFIVLEPIDPTTFEKNQSILSVVLSRLLNKAEEYWSEQRNFYGNFQDKEKMKSKLLYLAKECLNGISAIKNEDWISNDLADLQRIGDSSILKLNFYDFIDYMFQFKPQKSNLKNGILVIQIDDTDCQIQQGYQVLEDIRKYLTIPNVIILMATDTKLLRKVTIQHYSNILNKEIIRKEEIKTLGEKYLVKLLPSNQVVFMPNIDHIIRDNGDSFYLRYYMLNSLDHTKSDILGINEEFEFQTTVLRYIYQKTHMVFVTHKKYANNIIPTTLRGLGHFLSVLSSMEDIPIVEYGNSMIEQLERQLDVLDKNLSLFEDYFMGEWISIKLSYDEIKLLEDFNEQAPSQRIPFLVQSISNFYRTKNKNENLNGNISYNLDYIKPEEITYRKLDELLRAIQGTKKGVTLKNSNREIEDFYFIFAVRTLLSIKNNRDSVRIRINQIKNKKNGEIIHFDFFKEKSSIPTDFYLESLTLYGWHLVKEEKRRFNQDYDTFVWGDQNGKQIFNFLDGIIKWLDPSSDLLRKLNQKEIFKTQEFALLIALNYDVQEKVRKIIYKEENDPSSKKPSKNLVSAIKKILELIQDELCSINKNMLEEYREDNKISKVSTKAKAISEQDQNNKLMEKEKIYIRRDLEQGYPKFNMPNSLMISSSRRMNIEKRIKSYCKDIEEFINDKKLYSKSIETSLDNLNHYTFHYNELGVWDNYGELSGILNSLYASIEIALEELNGN